MLLPVPGLRCSWKCTAGREEQLYVMRVSPDRRALTCRFSSDVETSCSVGPALCIYFGNYKPSNS